MRSFLMIFLVTMTTFVFAQKDMKYGKIDKADLSMTTYKADPEASAVVLGETMSVKFTLTSDNEPRLTYYYHVRIKILDKKGFEEADIQIPYYAYERGEKINKIKAQTINWKDGKEVTTSVSKKEIFDEKKSDFISLKKISFPAVEVGSILELRYEMDSDYYLSIDDYFFQRGIPVRWSTYNVKVPEMFVYRYDTQGKHPFSVEDQKSVSLLLGGNVGDILGTNYRWEMKDIPALKKEPYITSMKDYYSGVRMRLASYEPKFGQHEKFISTWPAMNNLYYKKIAKKTYLKGNSSAKAWEASESLVAGKEPLEKVQILYQFVQDNLSWNGNEEINPDRNLDYAFEDKKGTNTEINLTLLALLKNAGIEAYPLLISTRDHFKPMNFLPYLYQFNHTLVLAVIDEKPYYLDASHKGYPMSVLHPNNLNLEGWLVIGEDEGRWVSIEATKSKKTIAPSLSLAEDGTVSGQLLTRTSGYPALDCRMAVSKLGEDDYLEKAYKTDLPNTDFENLSFDKLEDKNAKLQETVDINSTDLAQAAGDMIYLNPVLQATFSENPFRTESRIIPVDMEHGMNEQYVMSMTIPENYMVEELPEPIKMSLPNNGASYAFNSSVLADGKVQIIVKTKINQTYYMPEEYAALRNFFDLIINKQNEQIVLKKKG